MRDTNVVKTKNFRTIVIDPAARTVEVIESNGSYEKTRELVGAIGLDHFRIADHEDSWDYGWCDDNGLARRKPVHAFLLSIRKEPIPGRCVLAGVEKDSGENCDAKFPLDVLRSNITWLGVILPEVTWDESEAGARAIVTYARVKV